MQANIEELLQVNDIGEISAGCILRFFEDERNQHMMGRLREFGVNMETVEEAGKDDRFAGLTFVVTGTLPTLDRKQAADLIEKHGGKVSGSVSKKTNYLLAGESAGSKLAKANDLGVAVISEEELQKMLES
jgi:DNA ligase (NAD+)